MQCYLASLLDTSTQSSLSASHEDPESDKDAGESISLRSINVVSAQIPAIENAREKVTSEMEIMVITGLANLVSFSLSSTSNVTSDTLVKI